VAVTTDGSLYSQRVGVLNGVSDTKKVSGSAWIKRTTSATAEYLWAGKNDSDTVNFAFYIDSSDQVNVLGLNSSGTTILQLITDDTIADTKWHHVCFSADLENSLAYVYIDRTAATLGTSTTTDDYIDCKNCTTWTIFDDGNATGVFTGSADDFLLWHSSYIDLTDEDTLRRLISSDGITNYGNSGPTAGTPKPVGYGPGGVGPTDGTEAIIVFTSSFLVNGGTGGAFTVSGTLSSARAPSAYRESADWITPGERWFDSDRSGFSYPRTRMLRDDEGRRIGYDEEDEPDRDDSREIDMGPLVYGNEEDYEDVWG